MFCTFRKVSEISETQYEMIQTYVRIFIRCRIIGWLICLYRKTPQAGSLVIIDSEIGACVQLETVSAVNIILNHNIFAPPFSYLAWCQNSMKCFAKLHRPQNSVWNFFTVLFPACSSLIPSFVPYASISFLWHFRSEFWKKTWSKQSTSRITLLSNILQKMKNTGITTNFIIHPDEPW